MRVFVDTNVWLSGILGHGLCADLLVEWLQAGDVLLLDARVRTEFFRIAETRFGANRQQLALAETFLNEASTTVPTAASPIAGIPDPDDAWILAAALGARADCFVTGDKALLELEQVQGLPIISPRTAYMRLRGLG